MEDVFIPVIIGTRRDDNRSQEVARVILGRVEMAGIKTELIDLAQLKLPPMTNKKDPRADAWREVIKKSDGLILVVPEYNHSFPGALKDALDFDYDAYRDLPVGINSVSEGPIGGLRMVEHLIPLLVNFGMVPVKNVVAFPKVNELIAAGLHGDEKLAEKIDGQLKRLYHYAVALKSVREKVV